MDIFGLRRIFNLFRKNATTAQLEMEPVDPKVQAYLDFLRDNGERATYAANLTTMEEPMLALPMAA